MVENLNSIIYIIEQLKSTSSNKSKEKIIKENSDNELFKRILFYTYNTDFKYGMQKKSITIKNGDSKWNSLFDMLNELSNSNINDNLRINIGKFLGNINNKDERELVINILLKDLRCNINIKSINKAIPNLIPSFDIMLGSKGELDKLPKGMKFVTEKYDGVRCFTQIRDGKIIMKSRQNKVFEGLVEIVSAIADLGLDNVCLDGELLAIDSPYETVYKDTMKIVSTKDEEKHGVKYMLFDIIPLSEFDNKEGKMKYSDRRAWLDTIKESRFINVAPILYKGTDIDEVLKVLDECRGNGAEGCMINTDKPYEFKRSKVLQKLKVMSTCDLRVIGFEEGDGKLKGTLGKIICNYKGFDLGVGSGFSEAMRYEVWNNQDKYLGKISEIQYFEETNNDEGGLSLRFPVFKQWRFDKEEESYE